MKENGLILLSRQVNLKKEATELLPLLIYSALFYVNDWNFRNSPALIRAGNFELDHRDSICWTTHDTQATTDTLLLVDDHVCATAPGLSALVHDITFHHTREAFHANTVIRADIHTARTENTD
jgi:hypothetical protein